MRTANFITEVTVIDPDSMGEVEISIFKHNESGSVFGIDSSFLTECFDDYVDPVIPDPFNNGDEVTLFGL